MEFESICSANNMCKLISEKLKEFTNLDFDLFVENEKINNKFSIGVSIKSISSNKILIKYIADSFVGVIKNELAKLVDDTEEITERMLNDFIEDICLKLIFRTKDDYLNNYSKIYEFVKFLEKISFRTYETMPVNIGIVIIKDCNNISVQLKNIIAEFIPIEDKIKLEEIIKKEKPLLKLVDSKSIALVLNSNFEVIGFLRKRKGNKSIENEIFAMYNETIYEHFKKNTLKYLSELLKSTCHLDKNKKAELIEKYMEIKDDKDACLKTVNGLEDLMISFSEKLANELDLLHISSENDENPNNNLTYVRILNREIQWMNNDNFNLSLKNGKWKMKQFALLSSCIFEYISLDKELFYNILSETDNFINYVHNEIDKINKLVLNIKYMSEENSGGLFIIFKTNENNKKISERTFKKYLPKNLVAKHKENSYYRLLISSRERKNNFNIIDLDEDMFKLIASVDGATLFDRNLNIISFGEILNNSKKSKDTQMYGARTNAAISASYFGLAVKVSEDGDIEVYKEGKLIYKI